MSTNQEPGQMTTSADTSQSFWERIGLFVLLFALFAFGLFDHSLWSSNDTREGAMVAEMYRTGTWVTPLLNGENYLEKPPLLHWTALFFCYTFGRVNEGLVRLPAAIFGFGAVLIAYLWGRKLGRERAALAGAFMCGTSILYLEYSKIVLTDSALTFMVMLSLYLFWNAYTSPGARLLKYIPFLIASSLAFYAKGLLGPGFIWVSVSIFLLYNKRLKLLIGLGLLYAPLLLAFLAPWIWALWKTGGNDFLKTVFWANQFGRFLTFHDTTLPVDPYFVHKEPIYYYLKALPIVLLPWTLLVPFALLYWFRKDRGLDSQLHIFLRIILISMLLILHVSTAKTGCYTMPILPIIFLMTAIWSEDIMTDRNSKFGNWAIGITTSFVSLLSILIPIVYILLLLAPQAFFDRYFHGVNIIRITGVQSTCGGLVMAVLSIALFVISVRELWHRYIDGAYAQTWLTIPSIVALLMILNAETIIPAYDYQRTYKPFARLVRFEKQQGTRIALAGEEEQYIGAFTFYLRSNITVIPSPDKLARFLLSGTAPSGVIIETKNLKKWLGALPESNLKVLQSDHKGYKCDYFRLIVNDKQSPAIHLSFPDQKPDKSPATGTKSEANSNKLLNK